MQRLLTRASEILGLENIGRAILVGKSLMGAFRNYDFAWSDLEDFDAHGAKFDGSTFKGTKFEGGTLREATLLDCDLRSTTFNRMNLEGADLTGSDLRGAIFRECSMKGVILNRMKAKSASFIDCDLVGAQYDSTNELPGNFEAADHLTTAGTAKGEIAIW